MITINSVHVYKSDTSWGSVTVTKIYSGQDPEIIDKNPFERNGVQASSFDEMFTPRLLTIEAF